MKDETEEKTFVIDGTEIKESDLSQDQRFLIAVVDKLRNDHVNAVAEEKIKNWALQGALQELSKTMKKEESSQLKS